MTPSTELLLHLARRTPDARRWLVLGGERELAKGLAHDPGACVTWMPTDVRERGGGEADDNVDIIDDLMTVFADQPAFDAVAIPVPQARDLARRWLVLAARVAAEGHVLVAGANQAGGRTAIRDALSLFRGLRDETYGQRHRAARFEVGMRPPISPAWTMDNGIWPGTFATLRLQVGDAPPRPLKTLPGVFSASRLDDGTRMLLDNLVVQPGERVLDAGCGCGVIGMSAVDQGAGAVDMVDTGLLAVTVARVNAQCEPRVRVLAGDVYSATGDTRYDLIVSNPPFHQGKALDGSVAARLIDEAPAHLRPGGRLVLVANAFLPYTARLESVFQHVETVANTGRYQVVRGS